MMPKKTDDRVKKRYVSSIWTLVCLVFKTDNPSRVQKLTDVEQGGFMILSRYSFGSNLNFAIKIYVIQTGVAFTSIQSE